MAISHADCEPRKIDWDARNDEIAVRLCRVRENLKLTQTQFASQLSITRERLATYEDGRTPMRLDVGIRLCRYFFVNEYWLATGSANDKAEQAGEKAEFPDLPTRLTMALAGEQVALNLPSGFEFALGFETFLRPYYIQLAAKHPDFPRIVFLPNEGPEYLQNAFSCVSQFLQAGLTEEQWKVVFDGMIAMGKNSRAAYLD